MLNRVSAIALFLVLFTTGCSGISQESSLEAPAGNEPLSAVEALDCINSSGIKEAYDDLNEATKAVSSGLFLVDEYGIDDMGSLLITAMQNSSGEIGALSSIFMNRVDDCGVEGLRENLDELGETLAELSRIYARNSSIQLAYDSGDIDRIIDLEYSVGIISQSIFNTLLEVGEASIAESETDG